jgi:hypothetical protein
MATSALPRKQKVQSAKPEEPKLPNLEERKVPTFDKKDVTVVFVLGKVGEQGSWVPFSQVF